MPFEELSILETANIIPLGMAGDAPIAIHARLEAEIGHFTARQQDLVNTLRRLYEIGSQQAGLLVFYGSHVVIRDGGAYYSTWRDEFLGRTVASGQRGIGLRAGGLPSSHYRGLPAVQYELRLPVGWGTVLFGLEGNNDTWFQLEAHSGTIGTTFLARFLRYPLDVVMHGKDFLQHKYYGGLQIGPCGRSPANEQNPIIVNL